MALQITHIADTLQPLGTPGAQRLILLQPGSSDYPSSGYPITALAAGLGNLYGAWIVSGNAAAANYSPKFVLSGYPSTFPSTYPPATAALYMEVVQADVQVGVGTDLSQCSWIAEFRAVGE
jgi:hypothetical protein